MNSIHVYSGSKRLSEFQEKAGNDLRSPQQAMGDRVDAPKLGRPVQMPSVTIEDPTELRRHEKENRDKYILDSKNGASVLIKKAMNAAQATRYREAKQHFEAACKLDPACLPAQIYRAEVSRLCGETDDLWEILHTPSTWTWCASDAFMCRAMAYWQVEAFTKAKYSLLSALSLDSRNKKATKALALLCLDVGEYEESKFYLEKLIAADPSNLELSKLRRYAQLRNSRESVGLDREIKKVQELCYIDF